MGLTPENLLDKMQEFDFDEVIAKDRFAMDDFPPFATYPAQAELTAQLQEYIQGEVAQSPRHQFNMSANLKNDNILPTIAPKLGFDV